MTPKGFSPIRRSGARRCGFQASMPWASPTTSITARATLPPRSQDWIRSACCIPEPANLAAARAPVIVARNGLRVGALQRSSVYWPTDHEAHADSPGIAVIRGHTAYHVPMGRMARACRRRTSRRAAGRRDLGGCRLSCRVSQRHRGVAPAGDIVVASCHWGLGREPLQYMTDIAHAAIDAAPTWSWDTGRITRCRWKSTRAGRSSTVCAI